MARPWGWGPPASPMHPKEHLSTKVHVHRHLWWFTTISSLPCHLPCPCPSWRPHPGVPIPVPGRAMGPRSPHRQPRFGGGGGGAVLGMMKTRRVFPRAKEFPAPSARPGAWQARRGDAGSHAPAHRAHGAASRGPGINTSSHGLWSRVGFPQGHEGPHGVVATSSQPQAILALETGTRRPSDEVAPPAMALPPGSSWGFSLPAALGASMRGARKLSGSDTPQLRGDRVSRDLPDPSGVPQIHLGHPESCHQHPAPSSAGPALTPKLVPCACPRPIYPTSRG